MIDEKLLLQSRPEALNDKMDMDLQNQKGEYNNGWNDCLFMFIDIIKKQPKVGEWIPFKMVDGILYCQIPDVDEDILVSDGNSVWEDIWREADEGYALDSDYDLDVVTAWMPLPKPYKEQENENKHVDRWGELCQKNSRLAREYLSIYTTMEIAQKHFINFKKECEKWLDNIYKYGVKENE